jgi:hypothetical protein
MAALTVATDRKVGGATLQERFLASAIAAIPFEGSLLGLNSSGYVVPLVAGQPFAGICRRTVLAKDAALANGSVTIQAATGRFTFVAVIAGQTQASLVAGTHVYASSDNDLSITAEAGNTFIGKIADLYNQFGANVTNGVVIEAQTFHANGIGATGDLGSALLADANATLTVSQLDLFLTQANTAARTLTLPPVAQCTGRYFRLKKTTAAAFAVTLQANAAENIDQANTYATATAQNSFVEIRSDGTQWIITSKI